MKFSRKDRERAYEILQICANSRYEGSRVTDWLVTGKVDGHTRPEHLAYLAWRACGHLAQPQERYADAASLVADGWTP